MRLSDLIWIDKSAKWMRQEVRRSGCRLRQAGRQSRFWLAFHFLFEELLVSDSCPATCSFSNSLHSTPTFTRLRCIRSTVTVIVTVTVPCRVDDSRRRCSASMPYKDMPRCCHDNDRIKVEADRPPVGCLSLGAGFSVLFLCACVWVCVSACARARVNDTPYFSIEQQLETMRRR